jgi:predicted transposase YdaD
MSGADFCRAEGFIGDRPVTQVIAMSHEDDASYKLLFSAPEVVRDLVLGFIPDEWLHSLDYTTLEKVPGSYVTDDLRHRADDVIWRVKADGEWV